MTRIAAGSTAPDFKLQQAGGSTLSLSDALKRGPVALAFFKVSCPVCQYTWPFLERIHQAYGGEKVTLWGISQDNGPDTKDYAQEFGSTFPLLLDDEGYPVSNAYGITIVPALILVGTDGKAGVADDGFSKKSLDAIASQFAAYSGKPTTPIFQPGENVPDCKPG